MHVVSISPDIERRATIVAHATGRSLSAVIEEALEEGLYDIEAVSIAENRFDAIHSGEVKPISHEELFPSGLDS